FLPCCLRGFHDEVVRLIIGQKRLYLRFGKTIGMYENGGQKEVDEAVGVVRRSRHAPTKWLVESGRCFPWQAHLMRFVDESGEHVRRRHARGLRSAAPHLRGYSNALAASGRMKAGEQLGHFIRW